MSDVSGLRPCTRTHLKKALYHTRPVGGKVDKYRLVILNWTKIFCLSWCAHTNITVSDCWFKDFLTLTSNYYENTCTLDNDILTRRGNHISMSYNGYRCRKWTQQTEFKSWARLFVFHIALILCERYESSWSSKIVGQTRLFSLSMTTSLGEGNL